jgi:hypothetical protein
MAVSLICVASLAPIVQDRIPTTELALSSERIEAAYRKALAEFPAPIVIDLGMLLQEPKGLPLQSGQVWTMEALERIAAWPERELLRAEEAWVLAWPTRPFAGSPTSLTDGIWRMIRDNPLSVDSMVAGPVRFEDLPLDLEREMRKVAALNGAPADGAMVVQLAVSPRLLLLGETPDPLGIPERLTRRRSAPQSEFLKALESRPAIRLPRPIEPSAGQGPLDYREGRLARLGQWIKEVQRRAGVRIFVDPRLESSWVYLQGLFNDKTLIQVLKRLGDAPTSYLLETPLDLRLQEAQVLEKQLIEKLMRRSVQDGEILSQMINLGEMGEIPASEAMSWVEAFGGSLENLNGIRAVRGDIGWTLIIGWKDASGGLQLAPLSIERRRRA